MANPQFESDLNLKLSKNAQNANSCRDGHLVDDGYCVCGEPQGSMREFLVSEIEEELDKYLF